MADSPALNDKALRMSYRIGRGEQGVLTFEPYKSYLLKLWRFRTPAIARQSSTELAEEFEQYAVRGDFVGMDMARKFLQMGMTRAKRYANYEGGRKYAKAGKKGKRGDEDEGENDDDGDDEDKSGKGKDGAKEKRGKQLEISKAHKGKKEKEEASMIFREVWERCKKDPVYQEMKERFMEEQKEWDKQHRKK